MRGIVLGHSPHRIQDPAFYRSGIVLAVNSTVLDPGTEAMANWFACWDTHTVATELALKPLKTWLLDPNNTMPKFLRYNLEAWEELREARNLLWFHDAGDNYTGCFNVRLANNICTGAADILQKMGCHEIILTGVDFVSDHRADGQFWGDEEKRAETVRFVNDYFASFPVPVYKTHIASPLNLPLFTPE